MAVNTGVARINLRALTFESLLPIFMPLKIWLLFDTLLFLKLSYLLNITNRESHLFFQF